MAAMHRHIEAVARQIERNLTAQTTCGASDQGHGADGLSVKVSDVIHRVLDLDAGCARQVRGYALRLGDR